MEKRQGFFSALKGEVARGLSPARSLARVASPMSGIFRRKKVGSSNPEIARSSSLRPALAPLMEGPDPNGADIVGSKRAGSGLGQWVRGQLSRNPSLAAVSESAGGNKVSDLRLLLGVMGAPLAPVHVSTIDPLPHLSVKDTPIVSSLSLSLSIIITSYFFLPSLWPILFEMLIPFLMMKN